MTDEQLEKEIVLKGLTAPRVTLSDINKKVKSESYTILPSGKTLVCEIILENGFGVRGEASVVDPRNFDMEIGKTISRNDAVSKIWVLEGYLLQERLYQNSK